MLSVLIEGTLIAAPVRRTSAKGSAFVTAQVRCHADDGESVFCSVIAFSASTAEALAQLAAGDTVADGWAGCAVAVGEGRRAARRPEGDGDARDDRLRRRHAAQGGEPAAGPASPGQPARP